MACSDLGLINVANFKIHISLHFLFSSAHFLYSFSPFFLQLHQTSKTLFLPYFFVGQNMAESPWLHQPPSPTPSPLAVLAHVTSYLKAFSSLSPAQMWLIYI
ncbi:hypothetical protein ACB092_05G027800 [Castanea dentata]